MFSLFRKLSAPRSKEQDLARREYILNILLLGSSSIALVAFIYNLVFHLLKFSSPYALDPMFSLTFLLLFSILLYLSKKGRIKFSAIILIGFLFLSSFYSSLRWGADIPQAILMFALIIVMSGILISTKFALLTTLAITISLIILSILQINHLYMPLLYWKEKPYTFGDTILTITTFLIIALVSWLFNREMERALKRARASELALKRQRDRLEVTVEKRTKQLKQTQVEKVAQLYRFAQFGKSASGLFHDLVNPLTLISLNLNKLSSKRRQPKLAAAEIALERAIIGTKRLESFVQAARKQVQDQEVLQKFSLKDEINQAIQMLEHKARKIHVTILFQPKEDIKTFGNPVKFNQLITNLLSNAIDSYEKIKGKKKLVEVRVSRINSDIKLEVQDWGSGINPEDFPKIFDPLFTTKGIEKGTGIGLSICKDIIEKGFEGKYLVESKEGLGTNFTVEFPVKKSKYAKPNN